MFLNIVNDLLKSVEGLRMSGKVQIGSKRERIFGIGGLRKNYLTRCQISRSKYYLSVFQYSEKLIEINWEPT